MGKKTKAQDVSLQQAAPESAAADVDAIAGALSDQAPEINEGVVRAQEAEAENQAAQEADAQRVETVKTTAANVGAPEGFNPQLHETDENGAPVLTPTGRFKKISTAKRIRGPRKITTPQAAQHTEAGTPLDLGTQTNEATAALVTSTKTALLVATISKEFELTPAEHGAEVASLTAVLNHYAPTGMPVHPLAMYGLISGTNVAKRLRQPETQSWWQKTKVNIYLRYMKLRGKSQNAAQFDSRAHNVGENNAGGGTGQADTGATPDNHS